MRENSTSAMPPRYRVLAAAAELFYEEGIRGVGVEAIAVKAQTTKMAIYRHFDSKDMLIVEWLRDLANRQSKVFDELAESYPGDARAQLCGWLRQAVDGMYAVSYRGCPFMNALAELPDRNHPARQLIERHKEKQAVKIEALCRQIGAPDPPMTAAELTFLLEGAIVTVQNRGVTAVAEKFLAMATAVAGRVGLPAPC